MDLRSELTACSVCSKASYPDNTFTPYVCYSCQWKKIIEDEQKELDKQTLCYHCKVPINASGGDLLCNPCHFKTRVHEVYPGLFISDGYVSNQYELLKSLGIKQILTVAKELKRHNHPEFVTMHISIDDHPDENIKQHFPHAHRFISQAPTLVHCYAGISRSASIVISYVMKTAKMNARDAISHCKKIRPIINPNHGFVTQLIDYANELGLHKVSTARLAEEISEEIFTMDEDLNWATRSTIFAPGTVYNEVHPVEPGIVDNFVLLQSLDKPGTQEDFADTFVHVKKE